MSRIFLIAGLGADCRIYKRLDFGDNEVVNVDWIKPEPTDTLTTYAHKLINQYYIAEGSIVIGNSMGGMIAVEISKIVRLRKVILISSIRTVDEAPGYFSFFRNLPLYRFIPDKAINSFDYFLDLFFGHLNKGKKGIFRDMLKGWTPEFLKWAVEAVLKWDNKVIPENNVLIIGDKDMVFPYKNVRDAIVIKGGTHTMIYHNANEINKLLKDILKNEST
jgi:pimeloyl-ACP methyl ester carboxylesterase